MFNDEQLFHDWRKTQGCCGCGGTHYVTLTNNRLLSRHEECLLCNCCCEPAHNDSSIFLYDIAQLLESTQARDCLEVLCTKCCVCLPCCCRGTKHLELRGAFGWQIIYLSKVDVAVAKPAIAEAISRQKPVHQH